MLFLPRPPLSLLLLAVGGALVSADLVGDELGSEWRMVGLLPRALPGTNLQPFKAGLGVVVAPPITSSSDPARPFTVDGNTFTDFASASGRGCDIQQEKCADVANARGNKPFAVSDCDRQRDQCQTAAASATDTAFAVLTSEDANFLYFCDP